jgi:uncharacterized repeat protein (TIGR01451 family)
VSRSRFRRIALAMFVMLLAVPASALATPPTPGAVISNGTVMIGVTQYGGLGYNCAAAGGTGCPAQAVGSVNVSVPGPTIVGLRYVPLNTDAIADGCVCEGWGVADAVSGLTGGANESTGHTNVTPVSFVHDATSAVATDDVSNPAIPGYAMRVVQDYHPSTVTPNLYEVSVAITNTGTNDITDLRFRRSMDWDIEPTNYSEWVTIANTAASRQLLWDGDNGFVQPNPLAAHASISSATVCGVGYTGPCDFTDLGTAGVYPTVTNPADHGASFDFGFGLLQVGKTRLFKTYYGAAPSETGALAAISAQGVGVYSLGEPDCGNAADAVYHASTLTGLCAGLPAFAGVLQGLPNTFTFGFVTGDADLSVAATSATARVAAGSGVTTAFAVHNAGPDSAPAVHLTIPIPAGVTFASATSSTGTCAYVPPNVVCDLGSLAAGADAGVQLTVTGSGIGASPLAATASTVGNDPSHANDVATTVVTVTSVAPVILTGPNASTSATTAAFTFSGDPGSTFLCSLDGSPFATCASPVSFSGLRVGAHVLSIQQVDAQGDISPAGTLSWTVIAAALPPTKAPKAKPHVRVKGAQTVVAPLSIASDGRTARIGCRLTVGLVSMCDVTLFATVGGRQVIAGHGHRSFARTGAHSRVVVTVTLTAAGRALLNRPGGMRVVVHSSVRGVGSRTSLHATAPTRIVLPTFLVLSGDLLFDTDSSVVKPAALHYITALTHQIPGARRLVCDGFTDDQGTAAYNLGLGFERAAAVCAILAHGTSARMHNATFGETDPRSSNAGSEGRSLNRRVEIHVDY